MRKHWAKEFMEYTRTQGIKSEPVRYSQGWLETALIGGKVCFTKSMTFDVGKKQYFQGVDTGKLADKGDYVLLCGGRNDMLRDIFIIPWEIFFSTLSKATPINTYKDKEYLQYKFVVRERDGQWLLIFHRSTDAPLDIDDWHHDIISAVAVFK